MKKITTLLIALFYLQTAFSQLPDGSIAPNFIATDIEGNEWELYSLLAEGKTVILDISATWCAPCWDYHNSGELETLYETYGPDGTDELFVFLIEGDDGTDTEDLYGTGSSTLGDWVAGTAYPIIDNRDIAEAFQILYFPTLFMICPDRISTQIGQIPAAEIYTGSSICPDLEGTLNASISNYGGLEGAFCNDLHFAPSVWMQNMGETPLSSATITLDLNNTSTQVINWTGTLNSYGIEDVVFDSLFLTGDNEIAIEISNVNGGVDDVPANNLYVATIEVSPFSVTETLELELQLDNAPYATYWEIADENDVVLYYGGDKSSQYAGATDEERYSDPLALIEHEVVLPSNGCYEFRIFDVDGNGLCCSAGSGYYELRKQDGTLLVEGADFDFEETKAFGLNNTGGYTNNDNLAILYMEPLPSDFCNALSFEPSLQIQNLGHNNITEIQLEISGNNVMYGTPSTTINLLPGQITSITLPEVTVTTTDVINVSVLNVNQVADNFEYRNTVSRSSLRRSTTTMDWIIDLHSGSNAHEIYWQIMDDDNTVLISGGNTIVGDSGGGLDVASPSDPGAYEDYEHIVENLSLPGDGCYHLRITDDGGNGFSGGGFGIPYPYFRLRHNSVGIFAGTDGDFSEYYDSNIEIGDPVAVSSLVSTAVLAISPNPVSDVLRISMTGLETPTMELFIYNAVTGKQMANEILTIQNGELVHDLSVADLPAGVYLVVGRTDEGGVFERFVVER